MRYIIMCGSNHAQINGVPRQLVQIGGERILDRTIRLLRQNGITDIAVTGTDESFKDVDAVFIRYDSAGPWINCFLATKGPTCYIFGDVFFSEDAIKTIVEAQTDSIQFFASAPPFPPRYPKVWAEPFAFKVVDYERFQQAIATVEAYRIQGLWRRHPIAWELWQVIKGTPLNDIDYGNYHVINDYTCDVDREIDIQLLQGAIHT